MRNRIEASFNFVTVELLCRELINCVYIVFFVQVRINVSVSRSICVYKKVTQYCSFSRFRWMCFSHPNSFLKLLESQYHFHDCLAS